MTISPDLPAKRESRSVTRVDVSLLIYSDTLSPSEISAQLGLSPTRMAERGIKIGKTTGFPMRIPSHFWMLSSESHEGSREFSQHLDWLLDTLMPAKAKLNAIALAPGTRMQCDGVVWVSDDGVNVKLGLAQMKHLSDLGLELYLQFAVYGADG